MKNNETAAIPNVGSTINPDVMAYRNAIVEAITSQRSMHGPIDPKFAAMPDDQRYSLAAAHWRAVYTATDCYEPIAEMHRIELLVVRAQSAMDRFPNETESPGDPMKIAACLIGGVCQYLADPIQRALDAAVSGGGVPVVGGYIYFEREDFE